MEIELSGVEFVVVVVVVVAVVVVVVAQFSEDYFTTGKWNPRV